MRKAVLYTGKEQKEKEPFFLKEKRIKQVGEKGAHLLPLRREKRGAVETRGTPKKEVPNFKTQQPRVKKIKRGEKKGKFFSHLTLEKRDR